MGRSRAKKRNLHGDLIVYQKGNFHLVNCEEKKPSITVTVVFLSLKAMKSATIVVIHSWLKCQSQLRRESPQMTASNICHEVHGETLGYNVYSFR